MAGRSDAPWKMPEPVQESLILNRKIWKQVHAKNRNYIGMIAGPTGTGKSYNALRIGEIFDPNFNIDRVAFTLEGFFDLAQKDFPPGSVIVLDEAGVSASSRDYYTDMNKRLSFLLQIWRYKNYIALFTLPSSKNLDADARRRIHGYMRTQKIDYEDNAGYMRYYSVDEHPIEGYVRYKKPVLRDPETGIRQEIRGLWLNRPSKELREAYEEKAESHKDKILEKNVEMMKQEQEEELKPKDIYEVIVDRGDELEYVSDNYGQKYIDADLIAAEFEVGDTKAKRAKKLLKKDLDGLNN